MNWRSVLHLMAYVLLVVGLAIMASAGVSRMCHDEVGVQQALLISGAAVVLLGALMVVGTRGPVDLSRRDGLVVVTFGWLMAAAVGALPYVASGVIRHPVSALFEAMSGFTTTGASVLTDLEALPRGILFWRALTHFFGGMGVLVLCVAILPFLGVGGMQLYQAEMPGPVKDRLTPRIASTAKLLWGVYVLLCAAETVLLRLGGLSWFDAACHAFATIATGGFSTRTASVGAFASPYVDGVVIVFMFLAGVNFALHYRALRGQAGCYFRDPEFRFYLAVWLGSCLLLGFLTWGRVYGSLGHALRAGFFQGTSVMTTTGFVTEDFDRWPQACRVILIMLMFVGGCAGSTGGGIKNVRIFILIKKCVREVWRFMQPQAVRAVKLGKEPVDEEIISNISAFFGIFVLVFAFGTLVMTFFTPDLETAFSSVIATLGNIGPGLARVGATRDYSAIAPAGQAFLTFCMLLGRLELYTVLVLFLPSFWKK